VYYMMTKLHIIILYTRYNQIDIYVVALTCIYIYTISLRDYVHYQFGVVNHARRDVYVIYAYTFP
jgi:hypothetical protein